jgi:hypothetical protein
MCEYCLRISIDARQTTGLRFRQGPQDPDWLRQGRTEPLVQGSGG